MSEAVRRDISVFFRNVYRPIISLLGIDSLCDLKFYTLLLSQHSQGSSTAKASFSDASKLIR